MTSLRELVEAATPGPWTWGPGAGLTVEDEATHHLIALVPELAAVALAAAALVDWVNRWSEDANDGEFALYREDEFWPLVVALRNADHALRARLNPEATE